MIYSRVRPDLSPADSWTAGASPPAHQLLWTGKLADILDFGKNYRANLKPSTRHTCHGLQGFLSTGKILGNSLFILSNLSVATPEVALKLYGLSDKTQGHGFSGNWR
jgi:hypothetical protein